MYISTIYDAYIAILDYKFIKHLCPILQGTFFFFFGSFLFKILLKRKTPLCHRLNFILIFASLLLNVKRKKKKEKKLPKSGFYARHFNSKMLVQENVALKIIV